MRLQPVRVLLHSVSIKAAISISATLWADDAPSVFDEREGFIATVKEVNWQILTFYCLFLAQSV
jgi:hypothetical protein